MMTRAFAFLLFAAFCVAGSESLMAQTQAEMNQEAATQAEAADKELNTVYRELMGRLDAEGKALLKTSQRAWLAFRDAEAKFSADANRGGSMAPMTYSLAIARLTESRTQWLREHLSEDGEEGSAEETGPEGAASMKQAGEIFFKAYEKKDRAAAASVATPEVLEQINWNPNAGSAEGLSLMDATHIYYVGGSIAMKIRKNDAGRWVVKGLTTSAD